MRISDWSSDVCSSDLEGGRILQRGHGRADRFGRRPDGREFLLSRNEHAASGRASGDRGDHRQDRKSVVWGKSVSVRVDLGGRGIIKKKNTLIKLKTYNKQERHSITDETQKKNH